MAPPCYQASAPGSLMLMGEYAVLEGYPAIVGAIDKRINVRITPRDDKTFTIQSSLGNYQGHIDNIVIAAPLQYVLCIVKKYASLGGMDIDIDATFSSEIGLGSSAAVTVAMLKALHLWQQNEVSKSALHAKALDIILQVQKRGSGADLAASIYGGIIEYHHSPLAIKHFETLPPIVVLYSGYKTTTTEALAQLSARQNQNALGNIIAELGALSQQSITTLAKRDWLTLGKYMDQAQQKLQSLGVSTSEIKALLQQLHTHPSIYGTKISGAGLGDCVIGLGTLEKEINPQPLNIVFSNQGVQ